MARLNGSLADYLGPATAILGPLVVIAVFTVTQGISWMAMRHFVENKGGDVASIWGLLVGFYVLVIAKGVKKAAEESRARERGRSVVEEVEAARNKIQIVGHFVRDAKWDLVQLRAEEVMSSCRTVNERWSNLLPESIRNDLLTTATFARSIANVAGKSSVNALTNKEREKLVKTQLDASELLSTVLGQCRKIHERGGG